MKNRIISTLFLIFMGVSSALFFPIALIIKGVTLFDRRLRALHMFTSFWASLYLWIMPAWKVTTAGRELIQKDAAYVIVSNHQSLLDILVAFRLFFHFKWVSKAEIFKVPFIGWNMVLNRYVKIKRGERESIVEMMSACEDRISEGSSVYFFPEGTRSPTGIMREFKTGAFTLAHKMKAPILPIVINGSKNALPKHSLNFHGHHEIEIRVLEPIGYESFASLTPEETALKVRGILAENVAEHRDLES